MHVESEILYQGALSRFILTKTNGIGTFILLAITKSNGHVNPSWPLVVDIHARQVSLSSSAIIPVNRHVLVAKIAEPIHSILPTATGGTLLATTQINLDLQIFIL